MIFTTYWYECDAPGCAEKSFPNPFKYYPLNVVPRPNTPVGWIYIEGVGALCPKHEPVIKIRKRK